MEKSPSALRTIGEVAELLGLETHVLRFWETQFTQIRPQKLRGSRRHYRQEDIQLLDYIRHLLHEEGFTIEGAKRHLQEVASAPSKEIVPAAESKHLQSALEGLHKELLAMREMIQKLL